ncbi:MAG: GHKL domain-containing protein [Eubacteriales bacterium]|nr:GHKL domain-containing protein [Eubacteriales bacterium]
MTLTMTLNVLAGHLEILNLTGCAWYFMKRNGRTIYRKKAWYILGFVLNYLGIIGLSLVRDELVFPLHIVLILATSALLFSRKPGALLLDVLLVVCLGFADSCLNLLFSLAYATTAQGMDIYLVATLIIALKIVVELLLTICFIFFVKREKVQNIKPMQILGIAILPAASVFFLFSITYISTVYVQLYGMWLVIANAAVILLVNVFFFYLVNDLFRANRIQQEMELFQAQNEIQYQYYTGLEKKYRESRKLIHDMKNHLQAVENLYKEQEPQAGETYVKDLYHMLNAMGEKYYSANKMLNIILNDKLDQARSLGIDVRAEVGDADFDDLRDLDITAVFANLLDNAIEAAKETDAPFLYLKINEVRDFRVVSIRNSRTEAQEAPRAGHMGLGLENVRKTLEQYHGTMQIEKKETEYQVSLMLPK